MRKLLISLLCVAVVVSVFATTASAWKFGKSKWPIKIEYVTFVDRNHLMIRHYRKNWKEVEKKSKGKLKFIYRGGPESIKIFAQAMAVYKGATDMVFTTPSFMGKLVKGTDMLTLCQVPVSKHREVGLYDYLNEVFNDHNMQFLQMYPRPVGEAFIMLAKEPIKTTADLKGKTIRGGDYMDSVAPVFGMGTVALKHFEEYNALERGLIDIGRMTVDSMIKFRLYEVAKYMIKPAFGTAPASWFMNLDKWNEIPPDLQQMIIDTLYDLAEETEQSTRKDLEKHYKRLTDNGVKMIEFKGAERKKYEQGLERAMREHLLVDNPRVSQKIYDLSRAK